MGTTSICIIIMIIIISIDSYIGFREVWESAGDGRNRIKDKNRRVMVGLKSYKCYRLDISYSSIVIITYNILL